MTTCNRLKHKAWCDLTVVRVDLWWTIRAGGSPSRARSGWTQNQSCAQLRAAEETKCAVRGPLVPSQWGGLQYNGGCQTNSSGQQRTAWHHFLPLTRGPNPAGIFQVLHSSHSQAFTSQHVGKSKAGAAGHKLRGDVLVSLLVNRKLQVWSCKSCTAEKVRGEFHWRNPPNRQKSGCLLNLWPSSGVEKPGEQIRLRKVKWPHAVFF